MNRVDPDGKDWVITITNDGNGHWSIHITVNTAIINESNKKIDMNAYIKNQKAQFERIFSMKRKDFTITATLNMREIGKESNFKGQEHLILLESFGESKKDCVGYTNHYGDLKVHMNSDFVN